MRVRSRMSLRVVPVHLTMGQAPAVIPTGSVHITSRDVSEPPAIVANYLADERDRKTSIAALRLIRRIAEQPAFARLIVREVRPGPEAQSDEALLEHIAKLGATSYHPIGTCKMGTDELAVVDPQLREHQVAEVCIADPVFG